MPITIRFAREDDADAIALVLLQSFKEFESLYTPGSFAATTPGPEEIRQRIQQGPVWIALERDQCLGTVAAMAQGEALYIRGMAVLPSARGRHLGEALLGQVEHWAIERQFKRLRLGTTPFLDAAINLYQNFGFVDTGEPGDLVGMLLITMEKDLAATTK